MSTNHLLEVLAAGETAVGLSCMLGSAQIAEEFALAGFDYVYLDQQHGTTSADTLLEMLRAVARSETTPLVRVAKNDVALIGQALDAGAEGVIVPMIEDAAAAAGAAAACRYHPLGQRSWGPLRAVYGLGSDPATVNAQVICLVMIESAKGLANVDEILATPGVDGVYIGPADLAVSLGGLPVGVEQSGDQIQLAAIAAIQDACARAGKVAAITGNAARRSADGFRMVTVASDITMIRSALATARTSTPQSYGVIIRNPSEKRATDSAETNTTKVLVK
ncbi:HpcH/HpaI aldolase family protein [Subtercola sp. RTI3]|uniref:HpcH/HpaI aldolase family protein n=1 Tax=Subtercola sp. RTI3 TaxID=3048639 RepID=UPI002B22D120|nr:aldolase/citrate lyase family protein [Subtercola sp. RTI3]MEA9984187.1 aldolase/citrate lyase family protein [Subtercola sp. RTI3]